METIKFTLEDDTSTEDSCVVYYFQKYISCLILKNKSITSIIWKQNVLLEMQQIVIDWWNVRLWYMERDLQDW